MAIWSRITALIAGGAVARGAADAVTPVLEPVRQTAWSKNKQRVLDVGTAAELVAQALVGHDEAANEAGRSGYEVTRLDALIALAQTAPGLEALDRMLNRKTIDPDDFRQALAKHKVDPKWWPALLDLADTKLDPVQLANAIHRGLVKDPGLLATEPPTAEGNVKAYPVYPIPALEEAEAAGLDKDRLGVLVGLMGLPMGPHEAAQAVFRGILTDADFQRAIAEGNTRNEWAEAIFEQTRQIPTARDFFENALRGYHDLAWAMREAKRHGMSDADALVIYQNQGRPMNIHQITQALARGAKFNPEPGEITDPYLASIVEGPLKPGYYELAESLKYTLPSTFAMRQLAESGVWDEAKTAERLKWAGWVPEDADEVAKAWTAAGPAKADPWVTKATDRAFTKLQTDYLKGGVTEDAANLVLDVIGVDPASRPRIFELWNAAKTV